jgi:hypothetical protein
MLSDAHSKPKHARPLRPTWRRMKGRGRVRVVVPGDADNGRSVLINRVFDDVDLVGRSRGDWRRDLQARAPRSACTSRFELWS